MIYCQPPITIILPTLGRKTLPIAVKSVMEQTKPCCLCIIFDTEKKTFDDNRKKYENTKTTVLWSGHCRNSGQSRNLGLQTIKTQWAGFLDDDDYLDTNYVKEMMAAAKNCDVVRGKILHNNKIEQYRHVEDYGLSTAINFIVRKSLNVKFNTYHDPYDDSNYLRACKASGAVFALSEAIYCYTVKGHFRA